MGLEDNTIRDENGSETYIYSLGHGNDIAQDDAGYFQNDPGNDTDRLVLTDLNLEDVQLRRVEYFGGGEEDFGFGASALEVFAIADGGSVPFINQFGDELSGLEEIEFADGTVIDRVQIAELAAQYGTERDDFLEGEGKIRGLGGDDEISSYGGDVQAIYVLGDGNDSLFGMSILEFVDINSDGVRLLRGPADELLIETLVTSDVLSVNEDGGAGPNPFPGDFDLALASPANIEAGDFGTEFLTDIRFAVVRFGMPCASLRIFRSPPRKRTMLSKVRLMMT